MVGHSGCGKSTLLNIVAGLERASSGGVVLEGREIAQPGIDRMVVFQNFSLMPWMTVFDKHPAGGSRRVPVVGSTAGSRRTCSATSTWWACKGGAEAAGGALGGMRQRVGLARAFSTAPKAPAARRALRADRRAHARLIQDELIRM